MPGVLWSRAPGSLATTRTSARQLQLRREKQPHVIQESSRKAQMRPCKRSRKLLARGRHANRFVAAIAQALVGFMWAMAKRNAGLYWSLLVR